MATRVTDGLLYNKGQEAINRTREKMVKNQEEAVTSKRVNKPSDDPVATTRVISLKAHGDRNEQVAMNLEIASSMLHLSDSSLGELNDVISRAKELAVQMSSSSNLSLDSCVSVASEVEQLRLRAVQLGNSRLGDRYIFGGYQTERAPFDTEGNYYGDSGVLQMEIDHGQKLGFALPGSLPFFGLSEVPRSGQNTRDAGGKAPTIGPAQTLPIATLAENRNINIDDQPLEYAALEAKSGVNVFHVLQQFADGLRSQNIHAIHESLTGLDTAFSQVLTARTTVGARMNTIESGQTSLDSAKVQTAEMLSQTQDSDTLKTLSDLTKNEHALTASLETSKRLLTPSLLDFLK